MNLTGYYSVFFSSIYLIGVNLLYLSSVIYTLIYITGYYEKNLRSRYDQKYAPNCLVIVPCKGITKNLEKNIRAFLQQNYQNHKIIFVVQSSDDPAYSMILALIQNCTHASVVISSKAEQCSQKNWNLITAIDSTTWGEVLAFGDIDIGPGASWLHELILPLSDPTVTISTGFRWLITGASPSLATICHSVASSAQLFFLAVQAKFTVGIWGGSLALRRSDYTALDVKQKWLRSFSTDISLSSLVYKHKKKSLLVATCLVSTDDTFQVVSEAASWVVRQVMTIKYYWPISWVICVSATALMFLANILPFIFNPEHPLIDAIPLLINFFMVQTNLFFISKFKKNTPFNFNVIHLIKNMIAYFIVMSGFIRTIYANKISWAGITYTINRNGVVKNILHP